MYLLDTNVLSELRPGKPQASPQVQAWAAGVTLAAQYVSVISWMELEVGILRLERRTPPQGVWAAEGVEAKREGKEPSLRPALRTVAVATAGKMGAKWDFSPPVAADGLLPPRLLGHALRSWLGQVQNLFANRSLPVDMAVIARCARLHVPNPAPPHDALIAATALAHGLTLVTRNTADFATLGVPLLNPWEFGG